MIVLAIHTSGMEGSVALARLTETDAEALPAVPKQVVEEGSSPLARLRMTPFFSTEVLSSRTLAAKTFASEMTNALQSALREAGLLFSDVQAVAVASGPGSFTGTRIGLATAKGLAEGGGLPMVMASSLALLAMRLPRGRAVMDAGRGEFYVGEFARRGQETLWERWMTREAMLARPRVEGSVYAACEESVAEVLCGAGETVLQVPEPDATDLARWFAVRGLAGADDSWAAGDGNYLRRTDAEVKRQASL